MDIIKKKKLSNKSTALIIGSIALLLIAVSASAYVLYVIPKEKADLIALEQRKLDIAEKEKMTNLINETEKNNPSLDEGEQEKVYPIKIKDKTINVSLEKYEKIQDSEAFSKGFVARDPGKASLGPYIWVFTVPMSEEDKLNNDIQISKDEYLRVTIDPKSVLFSISVDKKDYWVHTRVYFDDSKGVLWDKLVKMVDDNSTSYTEFMQRQEALNREATQMFDAEIKNVRSLLQNDF